MAEITEQELSNFVAASFPSVWALETLLLLKRRAPGGQSMEQLISGLRSSELAISQGLRQLGHAGMVVQKNDEYHYSPASPILASLVDAVELAYETKPVWLMNVILRAKNENLQVFANSFKLKE